jgi:hypothetical protein
MKKIKIYSLSAVLFLLGAFSNLNAQEQSTKKLYSSTSFEIIFSLANVDADTMSVKNIVRFAPVFNFQWVLNYDLSKNFGVFSGTNIRNLGLIREIENTSPVKKYKHRVYTLGVPIGLKLGNLENGMFLYGGYEIEWAWNYKQKEFENGDKIKKDIYWNPKQVNQWQQSVFVGVNFPYGMNIKFKYYLDNLLKQDYVSYDANGVTSMPYAGQNSQIFYFSLNFFMFEPISSYTNYVDGFESERAQRARLERNSVF